MMWPSGLKVIIPFSTDEQARTYMELTFEGAVDRRKVRRYLRRWVRTRLGTHARKSFLNDLIHKDSKWNDARSRYPNWYE